MDIAAANEQMKKMYAKARAARKEGKHDAARGFRTAGERLQRKVKAAKIATPPPKKEKKEEGESEG